jgi:fatty-acyl-CoA synthase
VVGVPDDRFGEAIAAVVEPRTGRTMDEEEVIEFVKERLARYKAPKHVLAVDTIGRAANGKVDYKRLKQYADDQLRVGTA